MLEKACFSDGRILRLEVLASFNLLLVPLMTIFFFCSLFAPILLLFQVQGLGRMLHSTHNQIYSRKDVGCVQENHILQYELQFASAQIMLSIQPKESNKMLIFSRVGKGLFF